MEVMDKIGIEKYPAYKDSGVQWLGKIPEHWKVLPLLAVAKLKSVTNCPERELLSVYLDKGVIKFNDVTEKRTNVTSLDLSGYQAVDTGDFVLNNQQAWRGSVGVSNYEGIVSPAYLVLSLSSALDKRFANYLFRDGVMVSQYLICSKGVGTIQRNLYWPQLKRSVVSLPPIEEQTAIANFLDRKTAQVDKAIAQKEKLIELLKERRQILIHKAVTRGLDPNVKMKDSGVEWIGDIPAHWVIKKGKFTFLKFEQGWSPQCDQYIASLNEWGVLKVGCVNHYSFNSSENKVLPKDLKPKLEYQIKEGDILISRANTVELVGHAALVPRLDQKLLLCDKLYRVKVNSKILLEEFYINFLRTSYPRICIEIGANGASPSMQNIGQDVIREMYVLVPPLDEQTVIVGFLNRLIRDTDKAIQQSQKQINGFKEYKASLINAAVTGKIKMNYIT